MSDYTIRLMTDDEKINKQMYDVHHSSFVVRPLLQYRVYQSTKYAYWKINSEV